MALMPILQVLDRADGDLTLSAHPCTLPHGGAAAVPKISRRNSKT